MVEAGDIITEANLRLVTSWVAGPRHTTGVVREGEDCIRGYPIFPGDEGG